MPATLFSLVAVTSITTTATVAATPTPTVGSSDVKLDIDIEKLKDVDVEEESTSGVDSSEDDDGPDLESKALFTHKDKELHCKDRELIHPCTTELRKYLKEKNDEYGDAAYDCSKTVFETNNDFWVNKNMTHLLLDLDTSDHNFDNNDERDNRFYQLGLDFGRKLLFHEDCLQEFDDKDELECRCPMLYAKILLLKYKNANRWSEAEALFDDLKQYEYFGKKKTFRAGEAFKWTSILQTPQTWVDGLKSEPVWPESRRKDLPIWDILEDNYEIFKEEALKAFQTNYTEDAYRFLYKEGKWNQILLFGDRKFTEACGKALPRSCEIFKKTLDAREVHHYPWTSNQNEQVVLLRMTQGTDIERHCGPSNNILNIHLGISGTKGAVLWVANQTYAWEDGKVIPWDGSYDHSVDCKDCTAEEGRIVLMVRYMHPDITKEHYRGNTKTHYEPVPEGFFEDDWVPQTKVKRDEL